MKELNQYRVFVSQPVAFDAEGIATQFESFSTYARGAHAGEARQAVENSLQAFGFSEYAYVTSVRLVKVFNQLEAA